MPPARYILICCDGTWCGPQMDTQTNVKMLADSFASAGEPQGTHIKLEVKPDANNGCSYYHDTACITRYNHHTEAQILYVPGCGLNVDAKREYKELSSVSYLLDCALATDIKLRIVTAYRFIMEHFQDGLTQVMLFGHSRGAYTARAVAGMIRNCGILDRAKVAAAAVSSGEDFCSLPKFEQALLDSVYGLFQSPEYKPDDPVMIKFKDNLSHTLTCPPVELLGLLDTVGALGIPKLNAGHGVSYGPEFYDTAVSKDVRHVWQGLAVHDRLTFFQPCHVRRSGTKSANASTAAQNGAADAVQQAGSDQRSAGTSGGGIESTPSMSPFDLSHHTLKEVWLPGSHYDVGRQQFVFPRKVPGLEGFLHAVNRFFNPLHLNVIYDVETADTALFALLAEVWGVCPDILPTDPTTPAGHDVYKAFADDPKPSWWQKHVNKPACQDAYDSIIECIDWYLRKLEALPLIGGAAAEALRAVIGSVVPIALADRHIRLEEQPAALTKFHVLPPNPERSYVRGPEGRYRSKAFITYRSAISREGWRLDEWGEWHQTDVAVDVVTRRPATRGKAAA